jgi:hypothetical protein
VWLLYVLDDGWQFTGFGFAHNGLEIRVERELGLAEHYAAPVQLLNVLFARWGGLGERAVSFYCAIGLHLYGFNINYRKRTQSHKISAEDLGCAVKNHSENALLA